MIIHQLCNFGVREGLFFHHMAPMTSRISYGKKDRFILFLRFLKRFFTPRIPIDWIMGMLQEIRAFFVNQTIGIGFSFCSFGNVMARLAFSPLHFKRRKKY